MTEKHEVESSAGSRRQLQGLPVIRRNVAGIDLGSERHWVCAPTVDGSGREIASYGATTPELIRWCPCQSRVTEFTTPQRYMTAGPLKRESSERNCSDVARTPPLNSEKVKYVANVGHIEVTGGDAVWHPLRLYTPSRPMITSLLSPR
jgi:hypothetical protein